MRGLLLVSFRPKQSVVEKSSLIRSLDFARDDNFRNINLLRNFCFLIYFLLAFIFTPSISKAQSVVQDRYAITGFKSNIELQKDTSLLVTETITINFPNSRHGIYRVIPIVYSAKGKTIKARFEIQSITDENGNNYNFEKSRLAQSVKLKIGDADKYVQGLNTYVISYKISKVLQTYDGVPEIYWNVTGSDWDTDILSASVTFDSSYAAIVKTDCFAGSFGTQEKLCQSQSDEEKASFSSTTTLGDGRDFTIVVALDKDNQLQFPGTLQQIKEYVFDNWGYLAAVAPVLIMLYIWYKKGRDTRYVSENIYFRPEDISTKTVSLFARRHIPFVYHPIDNLSPSEVGTIIDEKVHISDVVAEILEIARLRFIKIKRIETKKLFGKDADYVFIKTKKAGENSELAKLKNYQSFLLEELFKSKIVKNTAQKAKKLFKKQKTDDLKRSLEGKEYILLSGIKNHFYKSLPEFRNMLYKRMKDEKLFAGNPEKTRNSWFGGFMTIDFLFAALIVVFISTTANFGPLIVFGILSIFGFIFAFSMPRRTAKGYSYFRQIQGLKFYLGKGKWRHEVNEKNLFIEEILPLAVALGVVNQITKDMAELDLKPPTYFTGSSVGAFSSDFARFSQASSSSFVSAPGGRGGASSWSGGSGFSGGFSGGGFGGGGGGSW